MRQCEQCKKKGECDDFKQDLTDNTKTLFGCSEFEPMVPFVKVRNLAKWMDENKTRAEFSAYDSPIKVIMSEFETKLDGEIMSAVQHYGITVDREELLKALSYDRDQSAKGFNEGHIAGVLQAEKLYARPSGTWRPFYYPHFEVPGIVCSVCGVDVPYYTNNYPEPNYCPNCGADNRVINLGGETDGSK